jgi:hypothetical protein
MANMYKYVPYPPFREDTLNETTPKPSSTSKRQGTCSPQTSIANWLQAAAISFSPATIAVVDIPFIHCTIPIYQSTVSLVIHDP